MLRLIRIDILLLAGMLLNLSIAHAALVEVPALRSHVTDLTQTLTNEQQQQLESSLAAFEQAKGSQIAVLIVPTTQPEAIEQYSIRVVDSWKLGREKQDDGVLLLVAKDDRKMRIEVGYGLEGAIPDLIAKRIISEVMAPNFRRGDFYGGIDQALQQIMRLISGEQLPAPTKASANDDQLWDMLSILFVGAIIASAVLRAIFGRFLGGMISGGFIGFMVWLFGGGLLLALVLGFMAFVLTLAGSTGLLHAGGLGGGHRSSGGWSGGGGGGFGGGGASGSW